MAQKKTAQKLNAVIKKNTVDPHHARSSTMKNKEYQMDCLPKSVDPHKVRRSTMKN